CRRCRRRCRVDGRAPARWAAPALLARCATRATLPTCPRSRPPCPKSMDGGPSSPCARAPRCRRQSPCATGPRPRPSRASRAAPPPPPPPPIGLCSSSRLPIPRSRQPRHRPHRPQRHRRRCRRPCPATSWRTWPAARGAGRRCGAGGRRRQRAARADARTRPARPRTSFARCSGRPA
ncbi:hypothetical protein IWQ56_006809, partial [Coemansia nantahalensis]